MKVKKSKIHQWLILLIGIVICFSNAEAEELSNMSTAKPEKFTLESALTYAITNNPIVEKNRLQFKQSLLLLDEVRAQSILPEFSLSGETGIVPEARGDIFDSPDKQTDLDGWGPFFKLELKLVQPLFTFGRRSSALSAAKSGIDLQQIKNDSETEKLFLAVLNSYYALAAAREAESIAADVKEKYDRLEKEVKKRLDSMDSEVDDTDFLEVKSNQYLIEEMVIKSQYQSQLAERAFNLAIGRNITDPVEIKNEKTPSLQIEESDMSQRITDVLIQHRDIQGLKTVINALQSKTKFAYSQKRPLIYLAGGVAWAYAPDRQDQTNPFAVDNFNYMNLGAFVGVKWDLNCFRKNVDAQRNKLEKESMSQNLKLIKSKIELEVLKALADAKKNAGLLTQAGNSLQAAKSWLRLSMENWDLGLGEVERLIKAYNAYYQLKGVEIERTLELNLSLVNFAHILGNTKLFMEWVKNEKVELY